MIKKTEKSILNRKARFDYSIEETLEAGLVLTGPEIKAIRNNRANIEGSYAKIIGGEVFLIGGNFNIAGGDFQRTKKMLLHKDQIGKLSGKLHEGGTALIPLKLYMSRGNAKVELALGKGLKKYDKREKLKKQDVERDLRRKEKQY
jgi:SsrA-binding protein